MVGNSGNDGDGLADDMPRPISRLLRTYGMQLMMLLIIICTCPPDKSTRAGEPLLYGTCTALMFASDTNNSNARCVPEPVPAEAKYSLPGCCFANAMRSFAERIGIDGCATSIRPAVAVGGVVAMIPEGLILLTQDDNGDPGRVAIHPLHLRYLAEQFGIVSVVLPMLSDDGE